MNEPRVNPPSPYPRDGRRLLVYVVYDRRGDVGEYISYALTGLRAHVDHILVVVNGPLSERGRSALEPVSDEILERENVGYDIEAHKDALEYLADRLDEYDEIVLANDTWYGPVRSFAPVFEQMDGRAVHFWGMTEQPEQRPHPSTGTGVMPRHLQSFWIAVRRDLFTTSAWRDYWKFLPRIETYRDALLLHETVFTETFERLGFRADVAFPSADFPSEHPAIFHADLLVERGCPLMKRRPFFHHPTFLLRHAIVGAELLDVLEKYGYPRKLVLGDLARNVAPRTMNADLALLSVAASRPEAAAEATRRIAVVVRDVRADDLAALARPMSALPVGVRLRLLVADGEEVATIRRRAATSFEVMFVEIEATGSGGPLDGYEDLVREGMTDLLVMVDAAALRDPADGALRTELEQQRESLLWDRDATQTALDLFERESTLGVVFPAMTRMGSTDRSQRWPDDRVLVTEACTKLGIRVPVDEFGPLFSVFGLWIARPAALVPFLDAPQTGWSPQLTDMLLAYAAGETGHHVRTIISPSVAATSHTMLEYTLDRLLSHTYGYRLDQIQFLQRAGWNGSVSPRQLLRMHTRLNHPEASHPLFPMFRRVRRIIRRLRRMRGDAS